MGQLKNQPKVKVKKSDMNKVNDRGMDKLETSDRNVGKEEKSGSQQKWYGVVDVTLLQTALQTKDEQVRLDAFALLCENQKTSEVIESLEINLIKSFIPDNLNNQNPAFRQQFISLVKKVGCCFQHCVNCDNMVVKYL